MKNIKWFLSSPVTWILAITWALGIYSVIDSLEASFGLIIVIVRLLQEKRLGNAARF